jgi:hypothetical protein
MDQALLANAGLDWTGFAGTNAPAYLPSPSLTKKKSFISLTPGINYWEMDTGSNFY